jgi:hypothetical protein
VLDAAGNATRSLLVGARSGLGAQTSYDAAKGLGAGDTAASVAGMAGGIAGGAGWGPRSTDSLGTPSVEAADAGRAVYDRALQMRTARDAAYRNFEQKPGTFTPNAISPLYQHAMQGVENTESFPGWSDALAYSTLKPFQEALATTKQALSRFAGEGDLSPMRLERLRQELNAQADAAFSAGNGKAGSLIKGITRGIDNGVEQVAPQPDMFVNGSGTDVANAIQQARALHGAYEANFGDGAPPQVQSAISVLFPRGGPPPGYEQLHQAGVGIGNGIKQFGSGPALRTHLENAGVDMDPVHGYAKPLFLQGSKATVAKNLSSPAAQEVFGGDLPRAQELNEASGEPSFWRRAIPAIARAGGASAGALFHPGAAAAGEYFAGNAAERAVGAGPQGSILDQLDKPATSWPSSIGNAATAVGRRALPAGAVISAQEPDRQPHASGGKVGHQHLVDRLFQHVEKAKRAEKARTSAILKQPDEAVAKALNVAQAAI